MSNATGPEGPAPSRAQLILSVRNWSPLEDVVLAVSVATEHETKLYVERLDDGYRWSLIHRGGPYPLLRITARFLQIDYHSIFIGSKLIDDGYSALVRTPNKRSLPVRRPYSHLTVRLPSNRQNDSFERCWNEAT